MEQVVAKGNMVAALKRVEQNGGAPGIDGIPTERLRDQIYSLSSTAISRQASW
jgi:hypothetical protein